MANERIKRKIVWETSGVSEIIGTILMLSITVVLFSGVITMVGSMPAPKQSFNVELKCSLRPVDPDNWTAGGVYFNILHQGGQIMDDMWIVIYIAVDDTMLVRYVRDGLQDANNDTKWNVGEYWSILVEKSLISDPDENWVTTLSNNSTFSLTIVDQERNTLVWHETLGLAAHYYAPIILRAWIDSDIATPVDDPGPISFEDSFKVYAEVKDPNDDLDKNNIWVNLSAISLPSVRLQDTFVDSEGIVHGYPNDDIYLAICDAPPRISVGYYHFMFNASGTTVDPFTNRTLSSMAIFVFPVGLILRDNPQIVVDPEYIRFSNDQPTNGDNIVITATIQNLGGAGARVNVSFYLNNITSSMSPPEWIGNTTVSVPQVGERDARMDWKASPGGNHTIWVTAWPLPGEPQELEETEYDNVNSTNIIVMPRILLVDDDQFPPDLSANDTVSFMKASLDAADFTYETVTVSAGNGPSYDLGENPLKDYDIVIWMTGYRETNTLTSLDVINLEWYLDGRDTSHRGGSLWFISQGFWAEARNTSELADFANYYLMTPPIVPGNPSLGDMPSQLYGNSTHPVTNYFSTYPIDVGSPVPSKAQVYSWPDNDITFTSGKSRIAFSADNRVYALSYDSDLDPDPLAANDSRRLTQTWGFSRINDTATQAQYAYKAIMWLGKIEFKFTEDLAISSMDVTPKTVFFKQPMTITFTVRNNGFETYANNTLDYRLVIYDAYGPLPGFPEDRIIDQPLGTGENNTVAISFTWTPEQIGYHRLYIEVNPNNDPKERNRLNNIISTYWGRGEFNVQYRILLIDDDEDDVFNETKFISNALDDIDYIYENYTIPIGGGGPACVADGSVGLSEFNAVIWVGGNSTDPFFDEDPTNVMDYMDLGGNFWFIGTDINDDAVLLTSMGIDAVIPNQGSGNMLLGVANDPISHGMEFGMTSHGNADQITRITGAVAFTQNTAGQSDSIRYRGQSVTNTNINYRSVATTWLPSHLTNGYNRAEFVYMVLRWFDMPEERIEARITNSDISILEGTGTPAGHPQIGNGYVIRAVVYNTGGETSNTLVRFIDGSTQIGSASVSVSPGEKTTAEMIWVPLFAGVRTIRVLVDPLDLDLEGEIGEVEEIFEWSNNNATQSTYVYFFWDDMESGASKWTRGDTVMRISGEGALDYFHDTELFTDVSSEWDANYSNLVRPITDIGFYHSYDSAYWLQEPPGGNTTGGTRGSISEGLAGMPIGPEPMDLVTEIRYMRGNNTAGPVNGLTAYYLGTTQSATPQGTVRTQTGGWVQTVVWGMRAWKRTSAGVETEITGGSMTATVTRSANDAGLQNNTWTCPGILMTITDSIVIRVYDQIGAGAVTQRAEFTTTQLGATQLESGTWNIYYYTQQTQGGTGGSKWTGAAFLWGTNTYNSRIEGFKYTTPDTTPPTVNSTTPANGATNVATDLTVRVTFDEPMKTTITPTLIQTAGNGSGGGGWPLSGWEVGDTIAVFTHSAWAQGDSITLEISLAQDAIGNVMVGSYTWSFTTASGATATAIGPKVDVIVAPVTITYSWVGAPTSVELYYSTDSGANWTLLGTDAPVNNNFDWTLPAFGTYHWIAVAVGGGSTEVAPADGASPEAGPCTYDVVRPEVIYKSPLSGAIDVSLDEYIKIGFSEDMKTGTFSLSITPNPGELVLSWSNGDRNVTIAHKNFPANTMITVTIINAENEVGIDVLPTVWSFTTGEGVGGGIDWTLLGRTDAGPNFNKSAVTEPMDLRNLSSAKLSFWHKYNLLAGKNGGFLQIGFLNHTSNRWEWIYVTPANAYTGNLDPTKTLLDSKLNRIFWCWNGISGKGTFGWDYVQMDLVSVLYRIPESSWDQIRVKFNYTQWGLGTGYGWYIDDVTVTVTRLNDTAVSGDRDLWEITDSDAHSGNYAWYNRDPSDPTKVAAGLDNYIMTQPIDLTNARNAHLSAYLKFNFNTAAGGPPDGFRIEVSKDNGVTWEPINLGVRAAWNVSGMEPQINATGKSYSGIDEGYNWVNVNTLTRVTTDLSSLSGNVILIRFRLVTNGLDHTVYAHNNNHNLSSNPGFGGFFIDDVIIDGETILT